MKPTTVIYLIRHGETDGYKRAYKGHIDVSLNKDGMNQIERVSLALKNILGDYDINRAAILSSPLKRAMESAEIISRKLGIEFEVMELLKERSFGAWEGMSIDEIISKYPEDFERWRKNPAKYSPPGGESTIEVSKRAKKAINIILEKYRGFQVFIIAHGGINRVIICNVLNIPLENIFKIDQDFACVNIIEFHENQPSLRLLNGVFWK